MSLNNFMIDANTNQDLTKNIEVYYKGKAISGRITKIEVVIDSTFVPKENEKEFIDMCNKIIGESE